jgi:hypothetical protein
VGKDVAVVPADTPLGDRKNLAFASALVTYGQASGIVIATGDRTEVGRIQGLIQSADDLSTPLTRDIARFRMWLMYVILGVAAFTFVVGLVQGQHVIDLFTLRLLWRSPPYPKVCPRRLRSCWQLGYGVWLVDMPSFASYPRWKHWAALRSSVPTKPELSLKTR